jgi:hypothetical protein
MQFVLVHRLRFRSCGICLSMMWVVSMGEKTNQSFIQIFILAIQSVGTNFSLKICRLLVEDRLSLC